MQCASPPTSEATPLLHGVNSAISSMCVAAAEAFVPHAVISDSQDAGCTDGLPAQIPVLLRAPRALCGLLAIMDAD